MPNPMPFRSFAPSETSQTVGKKKAHPERVGVVPRRGRCSELVFQAHLVEGRSDVCGHVLLVESLALVVQVHGDRLGVDLAVLLDAVTSTCEFECSLRNGRAIRHHLTQLAVVGSAEDLLHSGEQVANPCRLSTEVEKRVRQTLDEPLALVTRETLVDLASGTANLGVSSPTCQVQLSPEGQPEAVPGVVRDGNLVIGNDCRILPNLLVLALESTLVLVQELLPVDRRLTHLSECQFFQVGEGLNLHLRLLHLRGNGGNGGEESESLVDGVHGRTS